MLSGASVKNALGYGTDLAWNVISSSAPCYRISQSRSYAIPRVIHQTWPTTEVPRKVTKWIRSWIERNPDWEYWFWTNEDIQTFLTVRYPGYLDMYNGYDKHIKRADAMRYFVLYEFGGVYVDIDMECLSPLDDWVHRFRCFLCEENYEHQSLIYHRRDPIIITSIMGCDRHHPFYSDAIHMLPISASITDVLEATGPFFLTRVFSNFNRGSSKIDDYITMLPPHYLSPVADPGQEDYFRRHCTALAKNSKHSRRSDNEKSLGQANGLSSSRLEGVPVFKPSFDEEQEARELEICSILVENNFTYHIGPESMAVHHWIHTMLNESRWKHLEETVSIKKHVPSVVFFSHLLNNSLTSKYYFGV
ncbi:hypothetical protein LSH36_81g05009 [Paralvinella palmiformis]|uniref:Uncharacterized protein n=1 Tax=Paralvinella palmiformis TaxID=53620 RepID=A0AAD9K1U1_9ANNE|nr:hypothetical protein LSH36_81g05009 [Paralvinella palmiformis]